MLQFDIVLLTEDRYYNPLVVNEYIQNILNEDAMLTVALVQHGLTVTRKSWSDSSFDWSTSKYVLFRTTWDYFDRFKQFKKWLEKTAQITIFINTINLIKWNLDKHYLQDIQQKDVRVVATYFINKGDTRTLSEIFNTFNITEAVIKPVVSGAARHTYRLNTNNVAEHNAIFRELISNEDMMFQPFQESIITKGEMAFILINGKFTHAVLKRSQLGDFRVQDDFGGTLHDYEPSPEEITFAENAAAACPELPLYARIDVIHDNEGLLAVMELEIIEPELWFRRNQEAAQLLAQHIYQLIKEA